MVHRGIAVVVALLCGGAIASAQTLTPEAVMKDVSRGRRYSMVFLHAGAQEPADSARAMQQQMAHLVYLFTLKRDGKLPVFGPFVDGGSIRGIGIANTPDTAEARRWFANDPHVKAGSLTIEVRPWFGIPGDSLPVARAQ